ncbi:Ion transport protein-domain-containing protein [Vararia minispora EC-137]|uniref:Ion transport protein-domain-containing protein n=1 Tax=Vararia minispora EC-137 TaxID=1314806 RepID=A0ACB8QGR0_9AGAM|nr:Ion transport protein-domain-containing protein [Vararia minispora EC-137]
MGLEEHIRLDEKAGDYGDGREELDADEVGKDREVLPDLRRALPLRGRTLGLLGPDSSLRTALYRFLIYPWTEPVILLLIIANAIILTIQGARTLTVENAPSSVKGYFHTWEDYALFALFVVFTLEAFARICVSGLILDPEVPLSSVFTSFTTAPDPASVSMGAPTLERNPSTASASQGLRRSATLTEKLSRLASNIARPFMLAHSSSSFPSRATTIALDPATAGLPSLPLIGPPTSTSANRPRADTTKSLAPMLEKADAIHAALRGPRAPPFLANILRSEQPADQLSLPFKLSVRIAHSVTSRNVPYLRHSWSRIDALAVLSFWAAFAFAVAGIEHGTYHIGVFRALSVLRTARLLAITSGTTTIMRSLKTARPLLQSVALFVLFAIAVFSIIGIQAFNGSFRRSCYLQPTLGEVEQQLGQGCGGYIDPLTLNATAYIPRTGGQGTLKGYVCPLGQVCREEGEPQAGLESFDTVYASALQVFIISSANGWSPLMYKMIDAEYFVSCFFFIVCIVVLNFWLLNLFVAVITNTFSAIREETHKSAFGAAPLQAVVDESEEGWSTDGRHVPRHNIVAEVYDHIRWCWVALALASLALQATYSASMSATHAEILSKGQLGLTIAFDFEILVRVVACLPDWRAFFWKGTNVLDLMLAVGSSIVQTPGVRDSGWGKWLVGFELVRFYRVILEIPRMKPLLLSVFGNMYGLANMTLFLLLINYISALVATQMLRGDLSSGKAMNFGQIYTSFLAIYQAVFSSENWTTVLYDTGSAEAPLGQTALTVLFFVAWFFLANFIVLQMFIAVINENFKVAEESKRSQQADFYLQMQQQRDGHSATWLRRLNPYRWLRPSPKAVVVENLAGNLVLPMQKALVQDYGVAEQRYPGAQGSRGAGRGAGHMTSKSLNALQQLFIGDTGSNDVPLANLRSHRKDPTVPHDPADEETERHLELLAAINNEATVEEDLNDAFYERRARKADFIRNHPTYDKTLWIFSQKSALRRRCQAVVRPAGGERIFGRAPSPAAHTIFQFVLLLTVIGGIVTEIIATPIYRQNYYITNGLMRGSWFDVSESVFGLLLVVEFAIKVIADGFAFTPNAYVRSIWNILDFIIMCGLLVNLTTGLVFIGSVSRFTRSLKALRALRLITLIEKMRSTFEDLLISGASRIIDAAMLAILYMIPYAVWGLTIFAGRTNLCNDSSAAGIGQCVGEFPSNAASFSDGTVFGFPVPRAWDNPSPSTTFSFDTFRSSLLILFEIVSLEGWIDVMNVVTAIAGPDQAPQTNASQENAIFFMIYNLLGAVVILTLFVSIIIGNFSTKTGSALLTQPQREWIDLQKLIKRQRPSKRPKVRPVWPFRAWCYDRAVFKHGWWSRTMTVLFTLHVIALMTQTYWRLNLLDQIRSNFFLLVTVLYCIDTSVRFYGLGYRSFKANGWNVFDTIIAPGSLITTVSVSIGAQGNVIDQLQKLFLVSIAFKLVQRMNNLNKLFKTAVASLPVIMSLLTLWFILFMFFAILFVEVFSFTKWHSGETRNQNYTSIGTALVMLAFMSSGEGWNQYMHDYAIMYPRCTPGLSPYQETDCGSAAWAFTLFIAWNLLSMYIFVNMFTGVVVDNFSYVFQMTGGSRDVTRQQMRAFKKVWAEHANQRTGYLERQRFAAFFHQLSGIFEVRIYPKEWHYGNIVAACKETDASEAGWQNARIVEGINLRKLTTAVGQIDFAEIRRRRNLYSRLYHEAIITHEQGKGISFTNMLMLLAHHKLIDDKEALVLKDLLVRTRTNDLVTDLVNLDRVRSLLRTITERRRFLAAVELRRRESLAATVPEIVVDDFPSTPPATQDITSTNRNSVNMSPFGDQDHSGPFDRWDAHASLSGSPRSSRLQRMRRTSDISVMSADLGVRHTREISPFRDTIFGDDPQDVLATMQNSSWGAMMKEAEESDSEEEGR